MSFRSHRSPARTASLPVCKILRPCERSAILTSTETGRLVSPREILAEVATAVPSECHQNIIIIGSLAAGFQLLAQDSSFQVRTKDIDCVLSPHIEAVKSGKAIAEKLLENGWRPREDEKPGTASTPDDGLPVVRLYPPTSKDWFIELLTVSASEKDAGKRWRRLNLTTGDYGLPSFQFLCLSTLNPVETEFGIRCARPEMMALANMLEHPEIKPTPMSGLVLGRQIKRSNKDLGRVLAIAWLSIARDEDSLIRWAAIWRDALEARFPDEWRDLAHRAGDGLKRLLTSRADLDEAFHTCTNGLLANRGVSLEELRITGERLVQDGIDPLSALGK
jgi:hypothetical protein